MRSLLFERLYTSGSGLLNSFQAAPGSQKGKEEGI